MKKNTWLMVIALLSVLVMVTTTTLAYLTDTDSDVNVMTLGNVDIEQVELQRAEDVAPAGELKDGNLIPFIEGQPLFPAVPKADDAYTPVTDDLIWGSYVTKEDASSKLWDDQKLAGSIDKMIFVENTGASPAYYRTVLAFECPEGVTYSAKDDGQAKMIFNLNQSEDIVWKELGYDTIAGQRYYLMSATYQSVLKPGDISEPSLLQVAMHHTAGNQEVELMGDTYEILAVSQAVQSTGFKDASTALDEAFGPLSQSSHPWRSEADGGQPPYETVPVNYIPVSNQEELLAAVAAVADGTEPSGSVILLTKDIVLDDTLVIPETFNGVIDMSVYSITKKADVSGWSLFRMPTAHASDLFSKLGNLLINNGILELRGLHDNVNPNMKGVVNNNVLTIMGGLFTPAEGQNYALFNSGELTINGNNAVIRNNEPGTSAVVSDSGSVNMNAGSVIGTSNALNLLGGSANINGGLLQTTATENGVVLNISDKAENVNISGGQLDAGDEGNGSVTINSGVPSDQLTITGGTFSEDSNITEDHYAPGAAPTDKPEDDEPTPAPDTDVKEITNETELRDLFTNGGKGELKLVAGKSGIAITESLVIPKDVKVELELNGVGILAYDTTAQFDALIINNGELILTNSSDPMESLGTDSCTWLIINNKTGVVNASDLCAVNDSSCLVKNNGGKVTLNNGCWYNNQSAVNGEYLFVNTDGGKMEINGVGTDAAGEKGVYYCSGEGSVITVTSGSEINTYCQSEVNMAVAENDGQIDLNGIKVKWYADDLASCITSGVTTTDCTFISKKPATPEGGVVEITTEEQLRDLFTDGGKGKLMVESMPPVIYLSKPLVVPAGVTVELDTNNNGIVSNASMEAIIINEGNLTMTGPDDAAYSLSDYMSENESTVEWIVLNKSTGVFVAEKQVVCNEEGSLICNEGGHVTLNGGIWEGWGTEEKGYAYLFKNVKGGTMTIAGVEIDVTIDRNAFYCEDAGSELIVNGGTVTGRNGAGLLAKATADGVIRLNSGKYEWYADSAEDLFSGNVVVSDNCSITLATPPTPTPEVTATPEVTPAPEGGVVEITTEKQLRELLQKGGKGIVLVPDGNDDPYYEYSWYLDSPLVVPAGVTVELDTRVIFEPAAGVQMEALIINNGNLKFTCSSAHQYALWNGQDWLIINNETGVLDVGNMNTGHVSGNFLKNNGGLVNMYAYYDNKSICPVSGNNYAIYNSNGGTVNINGYLELGPNRGAYYCIGEGSVINVNAGSYCYGDKSQGIDTQLLALTEDGGKINLLSGIHNWYPINRSTLDELISGDVTISEEVEIKITNN